MNINFQLQQEQLQTTQIYIASFFVLFFFKEKQQQRQRETSFWSVPLLIYTKVLQNFFFLWYVAPLPDFHSEEL